MRLDVYVYVLFIVLRFPVVALFYWRVPSGEASDELFAMKSISFANSIIHLKFNFTSIQMRTSNSGAFLPLISFHVSVCQ